MTSIKKNFSLNFIYQILNIGIALITTPYISRVLGATSSGVYSYHYSIANYFLLFAMLGINNYGNRCIAFVRDDESKRSKVFSELYTLQCITTLISSCVYLIYMFSICEDPKIALILLLYLGSAFFDVNWFFFGMEQFSITVTRSIIIKFSLTAGIFIFVKNKDDFYIYAFLVAVSQLLSTLAVIPFLHRYVRYQRPSLQELRKHIKPLLILFIPVLAISIYNILDKIMLGAMSTKSEVGYYNYSEKIMQIPNAFILAAGTVMLPRMAHMAQNGDKAAALEYIQKSLHVIMYFAIGMAFGIAGIAYNLIPVFLGSEYNSCILLVQVLTPIIVFKAWANVIRTQYLIPYCKDNIYITSVILGAVVNVISNYLLIPRFQALGAVIGTVLAEVIVMLYQSVAVNRELHLGAHVLYSIRYVVLGTITLFALEWLNRQMTQGFLALLCDLGLGVMIYLGGTALINYRQIKERLTKSVRD